MALNTPAQFGRALNFGRAAPLPMWNKSGGTDYGYPATLGWMYILLDLEALAVYSYGPPFLDFIATVDPFIALESEIGQFLSARARIHRHIEKRGKMASGRITRISRD